MFYTSERWWNPDPQSAMQMGVRRSLCSLQLDWDPQRPVFAHTEHRSSGEAPPPSAAAASGAEHSVAHRSGNIFSRGKMRPERDTRYWLHYIRVRDTGLLLARPLVFLVVPLGFWVEREEDNQKSGMLWVRQVRTLARGRARMPRLHGNVWPLPRAPGGGEWKWRRRCVRVSARLIMRGTKWTSHGVHLFCVDYPSAAKRLSIYRNEMKRERERERPTRKSTEAISPLTSLPPCRRSLFCVVWFCSSVSESCREG